MKLIRLIFKVLINTYFVSADPNLFGATNKRKASYRLADEYKKEASDTQGLIDQARVANPFESAGAKAAMAQASRGAKQMENRLLNTMGANGSTPEALIAAQGATGEALGSAAGSIATGAEANKINEINNLESLKASQMGQYGSNKNQGIAQMGGGWKTAFEGINAVGNLASGIGGAAKALAKPVAGV